MRLLRVFVAAGVVAILWTAVAAQGPATGFLRKPRPDAIRMMTWNIAINSVFPQDGQRVDPAGAGRPAQFARVLRAVQPDVLCLQEATMPVQRAVDAVSQMLPLPDSGAWQGHNMVDTIVLTRLGVSARGGGSVEGVRRRGHTIVLIDLPGERPRALRVTCAHFQSSNAAEDIDLRQRHAEAVMADIREAKAGNGEVPMPRRTPFVILGDLNAVPGLTAFVDDILTGTVPGAPAARGRTGLDWDGSSLTDLQPRHNGSGRETYTWRNDLDLYPPSALDRVLYSDNVLSVANRFVLDTMSMPPEHLKQSGLRAVDVMRDPAAGVHDHYPIVVDFLVK